VLIPSRWYQIRLDGEERRALPTFPRTGSLRNHPWNFINLHSSDELDINLSEQIGVYILWFEFRGWARPIYVGQTTRSFRAEALSDRNTNLYRDSLELYDIPEYNEGGRYYLSFLYSPNPRRAGDGYANTVTNEITACEDDLIARGIVVNPNLMNNRNAGFHGYVIDQVPSTGFDDGRNDRVGDAKALTEGFAMPWRVSETGTRVLWDRNRWPAGYYRPAQNVLSTMRGSLRIYPETYNL